jgi:ubiquitin-protein ligase
MSAISQLKTLFEKVYNTKVTSYFIEEKVDAKENQGFKVIQAKYGSGAGYSGDQEETNLSGMKAKHDELMAHDSEFGAMFEELLNAESKVFTEFEDLNFILAYFLREANISEMIESRSELYLSIVKLTAALSGDSSTKSYLLPPNQNGNIGKLMKQKRKEGRAYIKCLSKDDETDQENLKTAKKLAKYINQTVDHLAGEKVDESKYDDQEAIPDEKSPIHEAADDEISKIKKWLLSKKFTFVAGVKDSSYFKKESTNATINKKKLQRLKKEISILSNSLPDGIFVKVDEDHFDFMKVMIIGPEGTPYENGCFLFDLYLPENFPQNCPKMKFLTTGAGTFYFNPNLYQEGKVCLSLLGTWEGPGWDPETCTLLQLLVSLQGMVFVDYPLENEPGYEGQAEYDDSLSYNKGIRHATLQYAMIWAFSNSESYPVFGSEAKLWLYANKDKIENQLKNWQELNTRYEGTYCSYFSWEKKFPAGSFEKMTEEMMGHLKDIPDKSYE